MSREHYERFLPSKDYKQPDKDEWIRNWEFVDSIDWSAFIPIDKEINVHNLIENLEDENLISVPAEQGGFILNWIDDEEFAEFINKKYDYKYRVVDKYNYYAFDSDVYILRKEDK